MKMPTFWVFAVFRENLDYASWIFAVFRENSDAPNINNLAQPPHDQLNHPNGQTDHQPGPPAANTGKFTVGGMAEIITLLPWL